MKKLTMVGFLALGFGNFALASATNYWDNYTDEQRHQRHVQAIARHADKSPPCKVRKSFLGLSWGGLKICKDEVIERNAPKTAKYRRQVVQEMRNNSFTLIKIPLMNGRTLYRGSQNFSSLHLGIERVTWLSKKWSKNQSADLQYGFKETGVNFYHLTGINLQTEFRIASMFGVGPALAIHYAQFHDRKDSVVVTPCMSITSHFAVIENTLLYFNWKGGLPFGQEFKRYNDWHFGLSIPILDKPSRDRLKEFKKAIEYEIRTKMACMESQVNPCP